MPGRLYEDYFDLQLRFARRYAGLAAIPRREAISRCTNLRRRFGLADASGAQTWSRFLDSLPDGAAHDEVLERTMSFHELRGRPAASAFGCFNYDAPDPHGTLRIHFMPGEQHWADSPLGDARLPQRLCELRALFADVRRRHPHARRVQGLSWLYNLAAYKRLFPPEYVASIALPAFAVHLNGSSTWGQVLNHRQEVKVRLRDRVLGNLDATTTHAPWRAFPLPALCASCGVSRFHESFG
jgi:hypothetical protein